MFYSVLWDKAFIVLFMYVRGYSVRHLLSHIRLPLHRLHQNSSSSGGGAHVRWNSAGANGGGSVLSGEAASEAGLHATQMHYVKSYSDAELRAFRCEPVRKMSLRGSIRACSSSFRATRRRIEWTFDAEWQRYATLDVLRTYTDNTT